MANNRTVGEFILEGLMNLHGRLPLSYQRKVGTFLGWLTGDVFSYRKDVVITNIARSFPDFSYDKVKVTAKQFYRHFGKVFAEMAWFGAYKGEKARRRLIDSHIVEISNPEVLNAVLKENPKVVLLESHSGNWELIGGILQYAYNASGLDFDTNSICVTYAALHNPTWDRIVGRNRMAPVYDRDFKGYVEFNHILRYALENRHNKMVYTFITDQFPYRASASRVEFMHQPTIMMTGGTALAAKMDMAVVYLRFAEREDGGYTMTFVPIAEHAAGQDPEQLMRQYYKLLEEDLRQQPWNYLWTHKRWK